MSDNKPENNGLSFLQGYYRTLTHSDLEITYSTLSGVDLTQLRIPGVLQRIGFTYFVCSVLEILFIPRLTAVENFVSYTFNLTVSLRLLEIVPWEMNCAFRNHHHV